MLQNSSYIYIINTIFKERHVGPLLKSGKSRQHVARRTLKTA
jgi:hypothetical protein